jgi:hypothetical protein
VKRFFKTAGFIALALVLCVVAFIGVISFLSWRSERQLNTIVLELTPGTPLSAAVTRLGEPTQTITTANEMHVFDRTGTHSANPDTTLYLFVHRGPPDRWVLVFTDSSSETIRHAEWQHM